MSYEPWEIKVREKQLIQYTFTVHAVSRSEAINKAFNGDSKFDPKSDMIDSLGTELHSITYLGEKQTQRCIDCPYFVPHNAEDKQNHSGECHQGGYTEIADATKERKRGDEHDDEWWCFKHTLKRELIVLPHTACKGCGQKIPANNNLYRVEFGSFDEDSKWHPQDDFSGGYCPACMALLPSVNEE